MNGMAFNALVQECTALRLERDQLRAEAERAKAALREVAQGSHDGEPCWCRLESMIPYRGHDTGCELARLTLATRVEALIGLAMKSKKPISKASASSSGVICELIRITGIVRTPGKA